MLQINSEFLEREAPQRESDEAPKRLLQGLVAKPDPVAWINPQSRTPATDRRELVGNPMWQADFGS
jgi:hypothetical protein